MPEVLFAKRIRCSGRWADGLRPTTAHWICTSVTCGKNWAMMTRPELRRYGGWDTAIGYLHYEAPYVPSVLAHFPVHLAGHGGDCDRQQPGHTFSARPGAAGHRTAGGPARIGP